MKNCKNHKSQTLQMGQVNLDVKWHLIKFRILKQNDHYVTVSLLGAYTGMFIDTKLDKLLPNGFVGSLRVCSWG